MRSMTRLCGVCGLFVLLTAPALSAPAGAAGLRTDAGQPAGDAQPEPGSHTGKSARPQRAARAKDPASVRESAMEVMEAGFTGGRATGDDYARLLERCSVGTFPAGAKSRQALGKAIYAATNGATITAEQAATLAKSLDASVNADSVAPDAIAARRTDLDSTLRKIGVSQDAIDKTLVSFDRVVADQHADDLKPLASALQSARSGAEAAADGQRQKIAGLIASVCKGATKPSQESLEKLAGDLGSALAGHNPTSLQSSEIARAIQGIVSSAGLPQTEMSALIMDLQVNMRAMHVRMEWSDIVITDCKSIYQQLNPK